MHDGMKDAFVRLEELEKSWEQRLQNQAAVIANLSVERTTLLGRLGKVREVLDELDHTVESPHPLFASEEVLRTFRQLRDDLRAALSAEAG